MWPFAWGARTSIAMTHALGRWFLQGKFGILLQKLTSISRTYPVSSNLEISRKNSSSLVKILDGLPWKVRNWEKSSSLQTAENLWTCCMCSTFQWCWISNDGGFLMMVDMSWYLMVVFHRHGFHHQKLPFPRPSPAASCCADWLISCHRCTSAAWSRLG